MVNGNEAGIDRTRLFILLCMYLLYIMGFSWSFSDDPGTCIEWVTANIARMNRTR